MRASKIIVFTIVAILVLVVALVGANAIFGAALVLLLNLTGIDLSGFFDGWVGIAVLALLVYVFPTNWLAWNRKYYIQGETVIDAPMEEVWDWMQIRDRDDYFSQTTKRIRAVQGSSDEFRMMFDERLNDDTDDIPNHIHIRLLDEEPHEYMAYHVINVEKMPLFGKDHLMAEVLFDQTEDGVRVRYIETLSRLTLTGFLALLFLNPARDTLKSLKAQIEGTENTSILDRVMQGMGPEGEPGDEVKRAINIGGVTAMVVSTAMVAGLMYFIMWIALP